MQKFIKELEQTYKLTKDDPKEKINLKFTAYSKNLKQNLENLFKELDRIDFITNALRLFHIKIKPANKGHLIFVTDGIGNPVLHSIKMSDFQERPRFYKSQGKTEKIKQADPNTLDKVNHSKEALGIYRMLFDLLKLIPNYSHGNNFRSKKQMIKRRKRGQRK